MLDVVSPLSLFEQMRDATAIADWGSGQITGWNSPAERLLGYTRDAVLGHEVADVLSGLRLDCTEQQYVGATRADGSMLSIEVTISDIDVPDSSRFALLVMRDANRVDAAVDAERFVSAAVDDLGRSLEYETTQQVLARAALPRLGELAVVYALDEDWQIDGVATAHVDGWRDIDLAKLRESIGQRLPSSLRTEQARALSSVELATLAVREHDQRVWGPLGVCSAMVIPLHGRERLLGVLIVAASQPCAYTQRELALADDLAEHAAVALEHASLYRTAQRALAARDRFLSIAAHELRAPLARLKSHVEVLTAAHADEQLDPDRLSWSVQRINAAVDRLGALTKDVLDLSRLRSGEFAFRPNWISLADLLRDLERRFAETITERHSLELDLTQEDCPVLVDQDRIEQILVNLIENAAKYSPDGGSIVLGLDRAADGVLLRVSDEGVGLPAGSEEFIFEAFGRAPNAERWNVPGMGLGLHICRVIVERHGGKIWATSDGEMQGTTLHVWLPFAIDSPMSRGEVQQRLSNQLTLAVGYCELLASHPELPPVLRAQALVTRRRRRSGCR